MPLNDAVMSQARQTAILQKANAEAAYRNQAHKLANHLVESVQVLVSTQDKAALADELLGQFPGAFNRHAIQRHVVDILLKNDDTSTCLACFPIQALNAWFMDNAFFAVLHCPGAVQAWKENGCFGSAVVVHGIAKTMERSGDAEKLALFCADDSQPLYQLVASLLGGGHVPWSTLSPAWIGPETSALRQKARALGFAPKYLMGMVFSSLWDNPEHWLGNVRYPYSICVCKWILDVLHSGPLSEDPEGYFCTELDISPQANCLDAALAQSILAHSPVPIVYTLVRHSDVGVVDAQLAKAIEAVVNLRVTRTNIADFSKDLCENALNWDSVDTYAVDDLV